MHRSRLYIWPIWTPNVVQNTLRPPEAVRETAYVCSFAVVRRVTMRETPHVWGFAAYSGQASCETAHVCCFAGVHGPVDEAVLKFSTSGTLAVYQTQ